jgi:hypothetical protein
MEHCSGVKEIELSILEILKTTVKEGVKTEWQQYYYF